jgi:hypothetical protein
MPRVPLFQLDESAKTANLEWVDTLASTFSFFGGPRGPCKTAILNSTNAASPFWKPGTRQPLNNNGSYQDHNATNAIVKTPG